MNIIGRNKELEYLNDIISSPRSEFVVVYGRRRVGKTFMIKQFFGNKLTFQFTGLESDKLDLQLTHFTSQLKSHVAYVESHEPQNWLQAFRLLIEILEKDEAPVKTIFIDELPWMDTRSSDLSAAIDFFWNEWASSRDDIKFIVCGSAASWMIHQFLENNKGFYNRVTQTIKLYPFTLNETKKYLQSLGIEYDHFQIIQIYMAFGGIPFYLNLLKKDLSPAQNINRLFFENKGKLKDEYHLLFKSLFKKYTRHQTIILALAKKRKGLSREEIILETNLKNGGTLSELVEELVASDFIIKYSSPGTHTRNMIYKLTDNFVLFYNHFVKNAENPDENQWINTINSPSYYSWAGLAFENICLQHIPQLKRALGIGGVQTKISTWADRDIQIDLIIDRKDGIINLVETKFSETPYRMTFEYQQKLANKIILMKEKIKTRKAIWFVLVSTYGLASMEYTSGVNKVITMEALFEE